MGLILAFSCFVIELSPALFLFYNVVAPDSLRIIIFMLGAFFWLLSLLLSGLFWYALYPWRDTLLISVLVSVIFQEATRIALFCVLKRAQHGLHRMAVNRMALFHDLHNARHLLATVSGLGMGVLATLFLTMNFFAALAGPGSAGLPQALYQKVPDLEPSYPDGSQFYMEADRALPYYFAFTGMLLSLLHCTWTIQVWDSCHKFATETELWFEGLVVAVVSHLFLSSLSCINASGYQWFFLLVQFFLLFANFFHCHMLMGGIFGSVLARTFFALHEWVTFKFIRDKYAEYKASWIKATSCPEEAEAIEIDQQDTAEASTSNRPVRT